MVEAEGGDRLSASSSPVGIGGCWKIPSEVQPKLIETWLSCIPSKWCSLAPNSLFLIVTAPVLLWYAPLILEPQVTSPYSPLPLLMTNPWVSFPHSLNLYFLVCWHPLLNYFWLNSYDYNSLHRYSSVFRLLSSLTSSQPSCPSN